MQHVHPPAPVNAPPSVVSSLGLGPEFEAIAERYGCVGGTRRGGAYALPVAIVAADELLAICEQVGLHARCDEGCVVFDGEAESLAGFQTARRAFRRCWDLLSERHPQRFGRRPGRVAGPRTPPSSPETALALSASYLERAYRNGFIAAEKKPLVVDFRTSAGMYMSSIDQDADGPLCTVLDSSSQIASLMTGFNMQGVHGVSHHPESYLNPDYRLHPQPVVEAFRRWLSRQTPAVLPNVTFVNSGTEAVEKALGLALQVYKGPARRILAFEGSFHGRTLLSLFSSWNPEKRLPFELAGYETLFVDYPENKHPHKANPWPRGWLPRWSQASESLEIPAAWSQGDPLLAREVASLLAVRDVLQQQSVFVVLIEPFQGEGGDRYVTGRFLSALRVLTRTFGIPLIFDEVQAGMGLSGRVFWYQGLGLRDKSGEGAHPDFLCLAKKAQAGVVLSSIPDPLPTAAHLASVLRGYYNAQLIDAATIRALEGQVWSRLSELADRFPVMQFPRARGLAFAFDLPDKVTAEAVINQRFARGYLVYVAGERTLRYRLHVTTTAADLDVVFRAIEESLVRLQRHGTLIPYEPSYVGPAHLLPVTHPTVTVAFLGGDAWTRLKPQIMAIEDAVYEPARRDTAEFFETILGMPRHVALVAAHDDVVVGFSFAGPLEYFSGVRGCDGDPEQGHGTCLYSADVTVAPAFQGQGIGQLLKEAQLEQARAFGYLEVRSRNRVGSTGAMGLINRSLGAIEVAWLPDDYGDEKVPCLYSSIPLHDGHRGHVHWSHGVEEPTGARYLSPDDWQDWDLASMHKLSMCNWVTPNYVRYIEWLRDVTPPPLGHVYLSNGRDEAADKAIKTLRFHRPKATICVSFEGSYWGHTTAGARSLSAPRYRPFFPWPRLPYPVADRSPFEGPDEPLTTEESTSLARLRETISDPARIIGVFIEPLQEMTGRWVSVRFLRALRALCSELDVPLVFNESASWAWRASDRMFYCDAAGVTPDVLVAYAGGQLGHTFAGERYFISKPLAMISTWDGDELSCLRLRSQMRYLETCRDEAFLASIDARLKSGVDAVTWRGTGGIRGGGTRLRRSICQAEEGVLLPPIPLLATQWEALLEVLSC